MKRKIIAKVLVLGLLVWGVEGCAADTFHVIAAMLRLQTLQIGDLITLVVTVTLPIWLLANVTNIASNLKKDLAQNRHIDE